jgi:hypothetical protein
MLTTRLRLAGCVLAAFSLVACAGDDAPALGASPTHPGWVVLQASDTLRWELDTASIAWTSGRAALWIAIVSVGAAGDTVLAAPFNRFETQQDVNCPARLARGLQVRTPDTNGSLFISPVRDTSWFMFQAHPLGNQVLTEVCRATGQL